MFDYRALYESQPSVSVDIFRVVQCLIIEHSMKVNLQFQLTFLGPCNSFRFLTVYLCLIVVTCAAPAVVLDSSKSPNQTSYDYNTDITYTCDTGYEHTSGDLTRTCTASSAWSGTALVCSSRFLARIHVIVQLYNAR